MVKNYTYFSTGQQTGFIQIDTLLIGEYTFGNFGDTTDVGIKENSKLISKIGLYPNPAKRFVNVDLSEMNGTYSKLEIINIEGKEVYSISISEKTVKINTENFAKGVYMVQIKDGTKLIGNKKLIIQ